MQMQTLRNVVIVAVLAAAVWALPGGGRAATLVGSVLAVLFAAGLAFFAGRLYLEHRLTIHALEDRQRGLLYGAVALAFLTLAATPRLWGSSGGTAAWVALLAIAGFAITTVYRSARSY